MRNSTIVLLIALMSLGLLGNNECAPREPVSASNVTKATVEIETDPTTGLTIEQQNIASRLTLDNEVGSIKHLYIISPYSGQVVMYSTVRGKVTSSGKRLTPNSMSSTVPVRIGGTTEYTHEVLQDDGTYGSSVPYIYWWDTRGIYHQHFFTGGQIIHISDQPIRVDSVILNLEVAAEASAER